MIGLANLPDMSEFARLFERPFIRTAIWIRSFQLPAEIACASLYRRFPPWLVIFTKVGIVGAPPVVGAPVRCRHIRWFQSQASSSPEVSSKALFLDSSGLVVTQILGQLIE